jgi:hypothetical protein
MQIQYKIAIFAPSQQPCVEGETGAALSVAPCILYTQYIPSSVSVF